MIANKFKVGASSRWAFGDAYSLSIQASPYRTQREGETGNGEGSWCAMREGLPPARHQASQGRRLGVIRCWFQARVRKTARRDMGRENRSITGSA